MTSRSTRPARSLVAAAGLSAGLLLASCGDDSSSTTTAAAGSGSSTTVAGGEATTTAAAGEATTTAAGEATTTVAGGEATTTAAGGSEAPAGEASISIKDFAFTVSGEVQPGQELTVTNMDSAKHTVTADDGSFDVTVEGGATASITAPDAAGTYAFSCTIHPQMTSELVVAG